MTEERYKQLLKESEEWEKACEEIDEQMRKEDEAYEREALQKERDKRREQRIKEVQIRVNQEALKEENIPHEERFHGWCDHPSTMENGTATFLWIAVMGVSILFKGGIILCVLETIIWWKFITRHN